MKKRFICACILLLIIPHLSKAQAVWKPGFIITQNGDTIHGLIENRETRSLVRACHFRESEGAETRIYTPSDIRGYRFHEGRYFITKYVDELAQGSPVFLEFLVQGEVSFYHYFDSGSRFFILKDGEFNELTNTTETIAVDGRDYVFVRNEFRGILSYYLRDANMRRDIDRSDLTPRSLINLAMTYQAHACPDEECIVFEKRFAPIKVIPGFHAGFASNKISFGDRIISDYNTNINLGLMLRLENVLHWNNKFIFDTGINVHRFTYYTLSASKSSKYGREPIIYNDTSIVLTRFPTPPTTARVNLNITALTIPVVVIYRAPLENHSPYAGLGVSNMFVINQTDDLYYYLYSNRYKNVIPGYHLGLIAKTGTTFRLNDALNFLVEFSFTHSQSMDINHMLRFRNNHFSLNFGVLL